jgi:phosphatidylglycerol---prolipoprotein diacylglyceryl transferase
MATDTGYWVHNLDPIAIHFFGDFGIRYYGLAYLLAFVAGYLMLRQFHRAGRSPLDAEATDNVVFALVLGVMLGGRLGYVLLYAFPDFIANPLMVFKIWEGGMSSHGGFIGVAVALWWLSRNYHVRLLVLGDLLCPIVPIGLLLGRVANFINGELWGRVTQVPWAVVFPNSAAPGTPVDLIAPRHPSQLYQAFLEGAFLLAYSQWRFWRTGATRTPGRLSGEFLVLYGVVRIIGEQFREPDAGLILGMSRGIFYSLFMLLIGAMLIVWSYRNAAGKRKMDSSSETGPTMDDEHLRDKMKGKDKTLRSFHDKIGNIHGGKS